MMRFGEKARTVATVATAGLTFFGLVGCTSIPEGQRAVTGFDIRGNKHIDQEELTDRLATRETSRFFGMRGVVYEYELYDRYALERDLARIERYYRARGYYGARVRAARVHDIGDDKVEVEIQVDEGEPIRIARVDTEWGAPIPDDIRREAEKRTREATLSKGRRLDEDGFDEGQRALLRALADRGYAFAKVTRTAEVDLVKREAVVKFRAEPGEPAVIGEITFTGAKNIPEKPLRRAFGLRRGDDYSFTAIDDGRQALLDLGVFATVEIEPNLESDEREPEGLHRRIVPVAIRLEVSKLRGVRLGGGVEVSTAKVDVHGRAEWSNENLFNDLIRLNLTFRPGLVFYPHVLPFQRLTGQLSRPAFLESRTLGFLNGSYAIDPQLFPTKTENVIGYHEVAASTGVQRAFGRYVARPSYGFQANFPYNAFGEAKEPLQPVTVSFVELFSYLDFRNDPLRPMRGAYFGNTLQYAGSALQGTADDFRIQPEARVYIPLGKHISLGAKMLFGFVFPRNYGEASQARFDQLPNGAVSNVDQRALSRDYQILYFRGLAGGGPNSNRGYLSRGIGPHDTIPYLIPSVTAAQNAAKCDPTNPNPPRDCLLPTGGLTQWESSLELRFSVSGPLLAAIFCDAGDVSPHSLSSGQPAVRFNRPHFSCGTGARFETPAGPIRFDLGYRVPGMQTLDPNDTSGEGKQPEVFGIPIAVAFGIGEAF